MQKLYVVLQHNDRQPVMTSMNSSDYPEYLQAGYTVLFCGNKKACNELMENEMELAY